jgi:hypothetical protein
VTARHNIQKTALKTWGRNISRKPPLPSPSKYSVAAGLTILDGLEGLSRPVSSIYLSFIHVHLPKTWNLMFMHFYIFYPFSVIRNIHISPRSLFLDAYDYFCKRNEISLSASWKFLFTVLTNWQAWKWLEQSATGSCCTVHLVVCEGVAVKHMLILQWVTGVKRPGRGVNHPHHFAPRLKKE